MAWQARQRPRPSKWAPRWVRWWGLSYLIFAAILAAVALEAEWKGRGFIVAWEGVGGLALLALLLTLNRAFKRWLWRPAIRPRRTPKR